MLLKDLLSDIYSAAIPPSFEQTKIKSITADSRQAGSGVLFVALQGVKLNGAQFIDDAVKNGASVVAAADIQSFVAKYPKVLFLRTEHPAVFLRQVVRRFYGNPSSEVKTIGVTGTNGKTTFTYLLESIIRASGQTCGVIGTINYRIGNKILESKNTTPGVIENQIFLDNLAKQKINFSVMEVSSHALDQGRVDLIDFKTAVFTNLTSDHLDYHKTREEYFKAKSKLFSKLNKDAYAIINLDDEYAKKLIELTTGKVWTYSINQSANLRAKDIELKISGTSFNLSSPKGEFEIKSPLVGTYNIYNLLAACGAALANDISIPAIQKGVADLQFVPGRLEKIDAPGGFSVFLDYAHTEDALRNVVKNIKDLTRSKIILVFGCGGDRDRTKRPKMGLTASELADFSVITSDNPRSEDPAAIIKEIIAGFKGNHYKSIEDRREAIHYALDLAKKGDIVLIAGKGHETYQIFKDKTIEFNERSIVEEYLRKR